MCRTYWLIVTVNHDRSTRYLRKRVALPSVWMVIDGCLPVVSTNLTKSSRSCLDPETVPSLPINGWFKERIQTRFHNWTQIQCVPYGRLELVKCVDKSQVTSIVFDHAVDSLMLQVNLYNILIEYILGQIFLQLF